MRIVLTDRLHDDGREFARVLLKQPLELLRMVVLERHRRAGQPLRNTFRRQPGEQVAAEGIAASQIGRQIPVAPPMVAAEGDSISTRVGPCNANGHGQRLAAGPSEPNHLRTLEDLAQQLGQFHFVRRVQRRRYAVLDPPSHGGVHVGIRVPADRLSHTHLHVDELATGKIPDTTALRSTEIGRPLLRSK